MSADSAFLRAVALHQSGRLDQAATTYAAVTTDDPAYVDAQHYLGLIEFQRGNFAKAVEAIEAAIALCEAAGRTPPSEFQVNLGNALKRSGRVVEAFNAYRAAIALRPDLASAWFNLGLLQRAAGDLSAAIESLSSACHLQGDLARAWVELGECHAERGADRAALDCFERVLPQLKRQSLQADLADLRMRIGKVLVGMGRYDQAIGFLLPLRTTHARNVDFLNALACAESGCGRLADAESTLALAHNLDPYNVATRDNLATVLKDGGQVEQALQVYRSLLESPDAGAWSNYLLTLLYSDRTAPLEVLSEHRRATAVISRNAGEDAHSSCVRRDRSGPTRLAYLSGDLRNHPVAYFMLGVLGRHDPSAVDVHIYDCSPNDDAWTARLRSLVPHWANVRGLTDRQLAATIRRDGIEVLIELSGHTADNRLAALALRPAKVQASYLGYAFSTGMPWIDWRLVDSITDPEGSELHSSERLYRLDQSYYAYTPPEDAPVVNSSPVIRNGYLTFGVSSNLAKVTPSALDYWADVLSMFKDARLLWRARPFTDASVRRRMLDALTSRGVERKRIRLEGWAAHADRWAFFRAVDVALDTYPYNQATNTCEALWMGVPTITFRGPGHQSRMGTSILSAAGLADWAFAIEDFSNQNEYAKARLEGLLAPGSLADLRAGMRSTLYASALLDGRRLARSIEAACAVMLSGTDPLDDRQFPG